MPGRRIWAGDPNATGLPNGWTDEIVAHTFKKNKDGSVSIECLINIYDSDGKKVWGREDVKVRLPRKR